MYLIWKKVVLKRDTKINARMWVDQGRLCEKCSGCNELIATIDLSSRTQYTYEEGCSWSMNHRLAPKGVYQFPVLQYHVSHEF